MNFDELVKNIDPTNYYTITEASKLISHSYTAISTRVNKGKIPHKVILDRKYIKGIDLIDAMSVSCDKV